MSLLGALLVAASKGAISGAAATIGGIAGSASLLAMGQEDRDRNEDD